MTILGIDVGSSSVKAAVLRGNRILGQIARASFETRYEGVCAEVEPEAILAAVTEAVKQIGDGAARAEAINLSVMSPSWVAMDSKGKPITPIVTHQDRRSVEIAQDLEKWIGKARHLKLAGNRPFPGGISSTTFAWFLRHERSLMRKADLVGHLNTYLHRQLTGARVTDPSNASFMGLYSTLDLGGWSDELIDAIGASREVLPEVLEANVIGGNVNQAAARRLGVKAGTPVMVGMMDGSAGMLATGAEVGQLIHTAGSTDVLALCTDKPQAHEQLLTRALGIGRKWTSVSTLAAGGSSLLWAKDQLFPDLSKQQFRTLVSKLAKQPREGSCQFEPYLAGDRQSIEQRQGAFVGLVLSTTREQMLGAIIESLVRSSAQRLELIRSHNAVRIKPTVIVSGGVSRGLEELLHRDWKGNWTFKPTTESTLRGLGRVEPQER